MLTRELQPRIYAHMNALTKTERKVAEFLIDKMEQVLYLSVTEFAEKANVGETTVLRFCRKIGFKGYQEFKLALAKDTVNPVTNLHDDVAESDEIQVMIQKITAANVKALQETTGLIDSTQLSKAIDLIVANTGRVHFYGVGVSGITATDAKSKLLRIGIPVDAITDSHLQAMSAATLTKSDIAIGLSVSGSTKDTVDALEIAKENGATVMAITHSARSPITKISDVVLLTSGRETPLQGGSMAAKISQLHVIDLLCTGVGLKIKEKALYYKEKTAKAVVDKAY